MTLIKKILKNGYIPLVPIIAWNAIFWSRLPLPFDPKSFNSNIPSIILTGENIFRFIIFMLPLFVKINTDDPKGRKGLYVYFVGSVLYYLSWLALVYVPESAWSNSAPGFMAPSYTPIIWLVGLGLMADSYYFKVKYAKWHFVIPSIAFSGFHIAHTLLVYTRSH